MLDQKPLHLLGSFPFYLKSTHSSMKGLISVLFFSEHRVDICYFLLQSKALRERWLLDGAPAEEETQKRLHEDEVKTKLLEQVILRSACPVRILFNWKGQICVIAAKI